MKMNLKNIIVAFTMVLTCAVPSVAQQKRALIIGISDYGNPDGDPDRWSDISGANDIALLGPLLQQQGFEVETLSDAEATYKNIIDRLDAIAGASAAGDMVYLQFSMHGQPVEDLDGDESDGWDEALVPVDALMTYQAGVYEGKNHLLDDTLEKYFAQIRSAVGPGGKLFVVLDACHSGTASRGLGEHVRGTKIGFSANPDNEFYPDRAESNDYFTVATAEGQSPVTFLEACRSYQTNKEIRDEDTDVWYGSLTFHIAATIRDGGDIDARGGWVDEVRDRMSSDRRVRRQNVVIERSE